jgi:hypothetical protein
VVARTAVAAALLIAVLGGGFVIGALGTLIEDTAVDLDD